MSDQLDKKVVVMQIQEQKTERIDIRTTATAKAILQQAAASVHKSVSEFLLDTGLSMAADTLADRKLFALNDEQWELFQQALDSPAKERPKLKKLLNEPSVFD
jgi:uncharacterized protein (DUF1778 family)